MERIDLPGWQIEFDREATAAACKRIKCGEPDACGCDPCRNWIASRARSFPPEFRDLLERLGIPSDREAEVYHNCRLESGLHSYAGWYHLVGKVISGEQEDAAPVKFGPFAVFFHSRAVLLHEAFANQPVVQLEFEAEVPWLSDVAEPQ